MKNVLASWLVLTASILITAYLLPGIHVKGLFGAIVAAAVLGIINAVLGPIIKFLSLPLIILSLGIFALVINAFLFYLASAIAGSIKVDGFVWAFWGSICVSIINMLLKAVLK